MTVAMATTSKLLEAASRNRRNDVRYFSSLDEVEEFVQGFGHTLQTIRWPIEIDAP
jgi:hypothetical protein